MAPVAGQARGGALTQRRTHFRVMDGMNDMQLTLVYGAQCGHGLAGGRWKAINLLSHTSHRTTYPSGAW